MLKKRRFLILIGPGLIAILGVTYAFLARDLKEIYHVGIVFSEPSIEHVFHVPNFTPSTLIIDNVQASCGCTVVEELPDSVPPFSILSVPVRMDITQKNGPTSSEIVIQFSGGRIAQFGLRATVFQPLPERVSFGSIKLGDRVTKSFVDTTGLFEPTLCKYDPVDGVEFQQSEVQDHSIVSITITPDFDATGEFSIELPFTSNADVSPSLYVEGRIDSLVEPDASMISMGYVSKDALGVTRTMKFHSPYGKAFQWRDDLTNLPDWLSLKQADPAVPEIILSLVPPLKEGVLSDTIELYFDVPDAAAAVVPVSVYAYVTSSSLSEDSEVDRASTE